ncbi:MAG: prolyl-tRNA synthetase associated domain-containing protein [Sphingopyxis sp.]|uniref:prolyl-tRNA synthetase associated domain-containing protein n=1 Tax=Sphingopyxis sp. TaxID=1908224 RepID=UPI001A202A8D|nr:prolyl-tRNA synthetase associated domain-containing protein [Sphingopyxis sp.]MBJ7500705.1 prolyl-tRNA synthetase associated domain-containing protein [Sphingopyxis sp.]
MRGEAGLLDDLDALAIPFVAHEHVAVFTVAESDEVTAAIPGAHTKNLFLKDNGGVYWLVTVPGAARVDLKALPTAIGSKRVSFGKAEDMERLLGIAPGSVTPLAAINAEPGSITVVLDAGLAAAGRVNVHPLRNTATIGLSGATILDLLRHWGHAPLVANIPVQTGQ